MRVRLAEPADAGAMSKVLVASISELCAADHGGRPEAIANWTRNKTPESVRGWLENAANRLFVAEEDGVILGVGGWNAAGEIILNYVSPDARFRGVSRAILAALEDAMRKSGVTDARLDSTATARRFYRDAGWQEGQGGSSCSHSVPCYPMTKRLA